MFSAGVGVGFLKLLESESGVEVGILKNLPTPQPWQLHQVEYCCTSNHRYFVNVIARVDDCQLF